MAGWPKAVGVLSAAAVYVASQQSQLFRKWSSCSLAEPVCEPSVGYFGWAADTMLFTLN